MKNRKMINTGLLFLTALIWGFAFVAQSEGNVMGPFTFNALRNVLGCISLIPIIRIFYGNFSVDRDTLIGGICCGLCLFLASNVQQLALLYTSPGKTGFITACYMVLVPIVGLFLGKGLKPRIVLAIAASVFGLYLLCIPKGEGFTDINKGDILALLCALFFTFHILTIDHFVVKAEGIKMSCLQFLTNALLSLLLAFIFEEPRLYSIVSGAVPLLYAGILSSGVAFSLQIVGQKGVNPTVASMIMSLESCFSVLAAWLLQGVALSGRELFGCVAMFVGIIITQLPERTKAA